MSPPVQMKLYGGLMLLTKRTYLLLWLGGFIAMVVAWGVVTYVYLPSTDSGRRLIANFPWFNDALNWTCIGTIMLEIIEGLIVLRKFREREKFLSRERSEIESPDDAEIL